MFDLSGSGKIEEQLQEERISRRGKGKVNVERKKRYEVIEEQVT